MKRRAFLAAASALLAGDLSAQAQPPGRIARVGILGQGTFDPSAASHKALTEGLATLGWKEGANFVFEIRYAEGDLAKLPQLAAELAAAKPDVVVLGGPNTSAAYKKTGASIPAVFVVVANPIALGLAQSLGRPGGNFTGLATLNPELFFAKQIELLREIVPRASRLAILFHPDNPIHTGTREVNRAALNKQGLKVIELAARTQEELAPAFARAAKERSEVMYVSGDPLFMRQRALLGELGLRHRLPAMFLFHEHVEAGGLISYGIDIGGQFRQAAGYVDKILRGAAPRDLPIEEPRKYVLAVNMKTARALGIKIPQTVLLRADRAIE